MSESAMCALGSLVDVRSGSTPSKARPEFWGGDVPWVAPKEMKSLRIEGSSTHITRCALEEGGAKLVPPPAVLIVVRGMILAKAVPVGVTACPVAINQDIKALIPKAGVDADYLAYMIAGSTEALLRRVEPAGHGTCRLPSEAWQELEIPLLSLRKQREVVGKVSAMTRRAIEIRDVNASLVEDAGRVLAAEYERVSAGAPILPFGEVATLVRRRVVTTPTEHYAEVGLRSFGRGTFHKPSLTGQQLGGKRVFRIQSGDLVFMNVFAWEGAIAVATPADDGRVGSHRFMTHEVHRDRATAEYLCHHFLTARGLEQIRAASPGSAGRNRTLGVAKLHAIGVPVPPIAAQRYFSRLRTRCEELRQVQGEVAVQLASFSPAVLAKAFRGEL